MREPDGSKHDEWAWNDTQQKEGRPIIGLVSAEHTVGNHVHNGQPKAAGFSSHRPVVVARSACMKGHGMKGDAHRKESIVSGDQKDERESRVLNANSVC